MKTLLLCLLVTSFSVLAQDQKNNTSKNSYIDQEFKKVFEIFMSGRYAKALDGLKTIEAALASQKDVSNYSKGFLFYWKGVSAVKAQEFDEAIQNFKWAIEMGYTPDDVYYELAQAHYISEKLEDARNAFKESAKRKYKTAVSLYYVAFLSQQLGEVKKAVNIYKVIDKLPEEEKKPILQPAKMQIADIYLEQAEKHADAFRTVEEYVIPQYEEAIKVDPESKQADEIRAKIKELQKKYELVLFNMRNGNPTTIPPYYLRLAQEISHDSNVTYSPNQTTISSSDQQSYASKTEAMGRYTFYVKNYLSIAPEMRFSKTRYFNREQNIYKADSQMFVPAVRTGYEHHAFGKAATMLLDVDHNYTERDVYIRESMDFATRTTTFMLGERFKPFSVGNTTLRIKQAQMSSYDSSQNAKTTSFVFEQMISLQSGKTIMFTSSYDQRRVVNDSFDTNALMMRGDFIFPRYEKLGITPTLSMSVTMTDPINNRSQRGIEKLYNPSLRLSKNLKKRLKVNFSAAYFKNDSKAETSFAYKKNTYGFELEYLF